MLACGRGLRNVWELKSEREWDQTPNKFTQIPGGLSGVVGRKTGERNFKK